MSKEKKPTCWTCIYCGYHYFNAEIEFAEVECRCGRGNGRWAIDYVEPPKAESVSPEPLPAEPPRVAEIEAGSHPSVPSPSEPNNPAIRYGYVKPDAEPPVDLIAERDREWCLALAEIGVAALAQSVRGGKIRVEREDDEDKPPVDLKEAAKEWVDEHLAEFNYPMWEGLRGDPVWVYRIVAAFAAHLGKP